MPDNKYNKTTVLIVGAGPAGLSAAIKLKTKKPQIDVCVIEKSADLGNHNLSGAVLETGSLHKLLDSAIPGWADTDQAKEVLSRKIDKDSVMFFLSRFLAFNIFFVIKLAKKFRLGFGEMIHHGDYIVSVSRLTRWLGSVAKQIGVEIFTGFSAKDIIYDESTGKVNAVRLIDQGLDKHGNEQPNFIKGETIEADFVILAEGCDGLLTEKFIEKAHLKRQAAQLYSIGVKELIKVSSQHYEKFTATQVVHAMGYPLWTPVLGPNMFGGGIMYPGLKDHISVGMIVGADWKYCDFNPQDALTIFKEHRFVKKFIEGGTVVEAGAHMIPEGGYYAIPRDSQTNSVGKANCLILGDAAGFVNMLKIKGLHLAIETGIQAGAAIIETFDDCEKTASKYTELLEQAGVFAEMKSAKTFRQTVAKFGPLFGMPLSVLGKLLPKFKIEEDYKALKTAKYKLKPNQNFDKDTFTAVAATEHREEQPSHLTIINKNICAQKCLPKFGAPCITFCPAGVYETIADEVKPANPSNCLHCKTCQRKCPYDNIRWTCPEGGGGPRYTRM